MRLQLHKTSVRFGLDPCSINLSNAGDVVESIGGLLRPWQQRAAVVWQVLGEEYGFERHHVLDAMRSLTHAVEMTAFANARAGADPEVSPVLGSLGSP